MQWHSGVSHSISQSVSQSVGRAAVWCGQSRFLLLERVSMLGTSGTSLSAGFFVLLDTARAMEGMDGRRDNNSGEADEYRLCASIEWMS